MARRKARAVLLQDRPWHSESTRQPTCGHTPLVRGMAQWTADRNDPGYGVMLYLFVRSGEQGMVSILCQAADKWRSLKEESPEKQGYSLKLAMFKQLLISVHERLTETAKNPRPWAGWTTRATGGC